MPAPPKPPRTPPKPRKPIRRKTPLPRATSAIVRRVRPRPMSDKKRAEIRLRTDVTRPFVLLRDAQITGVGQPACRACHGVQIPGVRYLEVNEEPPRSRGGDPNNPADCLTLCRLAIGGGCHPAMKSHGANRITIEKGPDGCNAPVTFRQRDRVWQG